ncbi:MAG: tRNA uridine-5-carboxymethylaminomethyl(34) synthesis enzyme MnmG [Bacteroidales bacterium]|nr:tRNA uridine-5-carboxymethylaminomethyl(34) synthesis enzyme MnmG [Bacteroidales bacterium]
MIEEYDIIVVGGGHAGCEAAAAAAKIGAEVLLITIDMTKIAQMSCNPAMGGIAKGQILREIDALGGFSGIVTDESMIQFRMLNKSKGPAVWSPRAQCDRDLFTKRWRLILENIDNLDIWQDKVSELLIKNERVYGVRTKMGVSFHSKAVILTTGTFEEGEIYVGRYRTKGGRMAEPYSTGISRQLKSVGIHSGRMKTGTPARIDGRTIDFDILEEQKGDNEIRRFSFTETTIPEIQRSCYITYTNKDVHEILKEGFEESPIYNGTIKGIGPRYCPSIETKIITFAGKEHHQLFLEPEGWETNEYYINGFSSSLPLQVQFKALRKIKGLENARIYRPGYAIEYDYYPPEQLKLSLESRIIDSLYFAGQVNGTTGYEEAGAQGIIAGINAARKIKYDEPVVLKRDEAYIGVLIDDLISKGVDEPYRMFTSRAEYRILLRQDNADMRLTPIGIQIGMIEKKRENTFYEKIARRKEIIKFIEEYSLVPEKINSYLIRQNTTPIKQKIKLRDILLRPEISIQEIKDIIEEIKVFTKEGKYYDKELMESIEVEIKYEGYIERERMLAEKVKRLNGIRIAEEIEYEDFKSISTEARQKLNRIKPETIGQALRIPGVSPSDINILLLYMGR